MNDLVERNIVSPTGRTANLIAAEINSIKEQTKRMVLYNSIEIGRRLVEAKELINHGEWGEWLEAKVDYSQSTANNLMRIFNEYGSDQITFLDNNAKSQALGNLSYTQAIAMLGIPSEERENFIKENDIDNMSTRELQKAIKEREQALKEKEEAEKSTEAIAKALEDISRVNEKLTNETAKEKEARLKAEKEASELRNQIQDINNKQIDYQKKIDEYKTKLEEAENEGNSEEVETLKAELDNLDNEVEKLKERNKELEQQLEEKPVDVTETIVEKIPEEIEKELNELRSKAAGNDKTAIKFSIQFDSLVKSFKELLGTLEEIDSQETKDKYKAAVKGLIGKMVERL